MNANASQINQEDSQLTLLSTHDIRVFLKSHKDRKIRAYGEIQGIVTGIRTLGKIVFFDLYDGTGFIQIIAEKKHFSEEAWHQILSLKKYNRVNVSAPVGLSKTGELSLILENVPLSTLNIQFEDLYIENHISHVDLQFFLSRLRVKASKYFCDRNYLEFEPFLISSSWETDGLQPLHIKYPGLGVPAYLAPSPSPQVLRALIVTGRSKVFCVARCFTTTYRDGNAGYESLILCIKEVGVSFEEIIDIAVSAISYIFEDASSASANTTFSSGQWEKKEYSWPSLSSHLLVSNPEIQTFRVISLSSESSRKNEIQIFRLCWPSNVILAEGAIESLNGVISLGSLTLHLESIALLAQKNSSFPSKRP